MATTTAASSPSPPPSAGTPSTPALQVNGSTPAAGAENSGKRAELRMTMLKKLRPYPLRHEWVFWHDRSVEPMYTKNKFYNPVEAALRRGGGINLLMGFFFVGLSGIIRMRLSRIGRIS